MLAEPAWWSTARVGRSPRAVVFGLVARKSLRSGLLWGYVFGLTVATSALGFVTAYPTTRSRDAFATAFGTNAGLDAVAGRPVRLETVAGYTSWKALVFLSVLGGIWGLLISTKTLRGEEEAGRLELLLAGQTTRRGAAAQGLGGLGVSLVMLFVVTAVVDVAVGQETSVRLAPSAMLFLSLATVSSAAVFLALGALASQLAATRRQAAAYAGSVLGVAYGLRMVADSGSGLGWLRWLTPIGWVEELQPLTSPHPLVLVPLAGLTATLCSLAIHLAGRRDLGASKFADRSVAAARTGWLSGPVGLETRLAGPTLSAWALAVAFTALLLGFVARRAGEAFATTGRVQRAFARLGAQGAGARPYLGVAFLILAVLVVFVAIGQVGAARAEEASGRLEHLLVRPCSRLRWFAGRCVLGTGAVVGAAVLAGVFSWLGTTTTHARIATVSLFAAGMNLVPPSLCVFGLGAFTLGVAPRRATTVAWVIVVWSLLLELLGSAIDLNHLLLDTSLFHQMVPAPAVAPDWVSGAVLVAVGAIGALLGAVRLNRRDLMGA